MQTLIDALLTWVQTHPHWAGAVVFAIAFAESLAVVGMIVPGIILMFGVGALIAAGAADFWAICAWAIAGAVLGDALSYLLGRHYRDHLRALWPFRRHPVLLEQGERFFHRYGSYSVAFARFVGPGRATVPLVAGMLAMPPLRFTLANVGSALLWAPANLLPGMLFGASLELASEVALRLGIILVLLLALLWLVLWLALRVFRVLRGHYRDALAWLQRRDRRHPRLRPLTRTLLRLGRPGATGVALLGAALVLASTALLWPLAKPLLGQSPPPPILYPMTRHHWLDTGWQQLPSLRNEWWRNEWWRDRQVGQSPLNLQLLGTADWLDAQLTIQGWRRVTPPALSGLGRWLAPAAALRDLPVLPHLHDGRYESHAWVLDRSTDRLLLRLWPAPAAIGDGSPPLWLGEISQQVLRERLHWLRFAVTTNAPGVALDHLLGTLPLPAAARLVQRPAAPERSAGDATGTRLLLLPQPDRLPDAPLPRSGQMPDA